MNNSEKEIVFELVTASLEMRYVINLLRLSDCVADDQISVAYQRLGSAEQAVRELIEGDRLLRNDATSQGGHPG